MSKKNFELAYGTYDQRAVDWFETIEAERLAQHEKLITLLDELREEMGPGDNGEPREIWRFYTMFGSSVVTGVDARQDEKQNPPVGWRYDTKKHYLMPALRTEEGKALKARFSAAGTKATDRKSPEIGVPGVISADHDDERGTGYIYSPSFYKLVTENFTQIIVLWASSGVEDEFEKVAQASGIDWTELDRKWVRAHLDEMVRL